VTGGSSVAIDGVFTTTDFIRIHADISFANGVGVDALWDFIYQPIEGEVLHGYVGAGPYAFSGEPLKIGFTAEVGWAYQFKNVLLILAMDWRPAVQILTTMKLNVQGIGLNVRYPISSY
jgi:hypothetical protein|tara:strand:- start:3685 stop:4041 length:357 start_codon:yes stop_codon:yes gene_type:complete